MADSYDSNGMPIYYDPTNSKPDLMGKVASGEAGNSPQIQANNQQNRIIGALTDPFNQMKNNWQSMRNDYSNGHIMSGLFDTYAMAKNPTGNWSSPQQSQSKPQLEDSDLGPANAHGNRPIQPSGYSKLSDTSGIADNSNLAQAGPSAIPSAGQPVQLRKGMFGRGLDNLGNALVAIASGGTLQGNFGNGTSGEGAIKAAGTVKADKAQDPASQQATSWNTGTNNLIGSPRATGQSPFAQMNKRDKAQQDWNTTPEDRNGMPTYQ